MSTQVNPSKRLTKPEWTLKIGAATLALNVHNVCSPGHLLVQAKVSKRNKALKGRVK